MTDTTITPTEFPDAVAEIFRGTAAIVVAYVAARQPLAADLPELIRSVRAALTPGPDDAPAQDAPVQPMGEAEIKRSITDEALISFEDGKSYRTLKRHLTGRGLTPAAYRAKWGLPLDYPMTAPAYSARRSELAKSIGLGSTRKKAA